MYGHYDDDNDDDDDNEVDNHHSRWTCPICGIDFQCSKRLIFHWDTEHRYSRPYVMNQLLLFFLYLICLFLFFREKISYV